MQREKWIDVLRGVCISFVVTAHVTSAPLTMRCIIMFAMPMFLLIGGWLHRDNLSQRQNMRRSATAFLLPYCCYLLLLWPLELIAAYPDRVWDRTFLFELVLKPMVLGGTLLKGYCAVFWFITCYFFTQQLVHFMVRRYRSGVCMMIFSLMLLLAYLHAWLFPQRWFPWNIHNVLLTAPVYYLGYLAQKNKFDFFTLRVASTCFFVAMAGMGLNFMGYHNRLDLKYLDYGIPLVTIVSAIAWCVLMANLVKKISSTRIASFFASIGFASITIMFVHQFIQVSMAKQLNIENAALRVGVALALGWLVHHILVRQPTLGPLFAGVRFRDKKKLAPSLAGPLMP